LYVDSICRNENYPSMKSIIPFIFIIFSSSVYLALNAQEERFFVPREIKQAYQNGTRSYDGKPGPEYWQNFVEYNIEVEVMPQEKKLSGTAKVTFHNNSPDDLNQIIIRLYHDVFREANPRSSRVNPDDITEGVEISRLLIGESEIDLENAQGISRINTNMTVALPRALTSGENLSMEVDWSQYIPETTIRTGAYDSTSFFIAYWYPQIAVYDDIFGWDNLAYDFSTEFYNNLGSYDVKITAPESFTVLSTGVLQNAGEVLKAEQLERYREAKSSEETIAVITPDDLEAGYEHQSGTWHYKADSVPDFAFCTSDVFCWDAAMQTVDGREVLIHSFYPKELREGAQQLTANQQKMMKHFSEDMPGIPYPYPEFCTFVSGRGGGGMEYPMMANNGNPGLGVTVHEMFHTYFPMYVRINEKRFAWMDEGWADFTTSFVVNKYFRESDEPVIGQVGLGIQGMLGTFSDLPLITSTQFQDNTNYGYASYPLPAFIYAMLYEHLGHEVFQECYSEYIRRWAYKSPTPYDFFYAFEDVSGQDLSWLWKPWFFEFGFVDVAIESFENGTLTMVKNGNRPVPLFVEVNLKNDSSYTKVYPADALMNRDSYEIVLPDPKNIAGISVNNNLPDADLMDNFYPSLKQRLSDMEIPKGIIGTYEMNQISASIVVYEEEEMLRVTTIPEGGLNSYLIPQGSDSYETIDGMIRIQFNKEQGKYTGLTLEAQGMQFTGNKKE